MQGPAGYNAGVEMSVWATADAQLGSGSTSCEAVADWQDGQTNSIDAMYEKLMAHRKMPGAQGDLLIIIIHTCHNLFSLPPTP